MNIEMQRNKKIVLVVEDDPNMNRFICDVLNESGYNPISTHEWYGASDWLERVKPDLLLIDFMLPDLNADKICKLLMQNEKTQSLPVIVMSSVREFAAKFASSDSGAVCFIAKPFTLNEFIKEVNEAVGVSAGSNMDESSSFMKNADDFLDSYIRKKIY
jgi:DNA-binding response OmpR family regulator